MSQSVSMPRVHNLLQEDDPITFGAAPSGDVLDPTLFINRELSTVEFQRRVLAQARDPAVPLLERLRFLSILSNILDEFFEVRVAGLKQSVALGLGPNGPDRLSPGEVLRRINTEVNQLVEQQYAELNDVLFPALAAEGIRVRRRSDLNPAQSEWMESYFDRQCLPVLTPLGLDPSHPFPNVQNKGLTFIVSLEGQDAYGREIGLAVVQVPRSLPRLISIPAEISGDPHEFIMLSAVIHNHIGKLFPGMAITGTHQFRVTRNSHLWVDEEEIDDLLRALKMELPHRQYGSAVRLEVADNCSPRKISFLSHQFALNDEDVYQVNGPVNLHRLSSLYDMVDRPDLKYPPFGQGMPAAIGQKADLFEIIRRGDVLLHHPYQSFSPVVELVRQSAADPQVLGIRMTLYRTSAESPIVEALIEAAGAGKDVTVVVELRARFDEATNIRMATRLQEAGANVVYGIVGYKTHAKVLMIVRREGASLRRYLHLGTGNYHPGTSKAYTDFGLLTCDADMGEDLHTVFNQLTGLGQQVDQKKILQSPFTLHRRLVELIDFEAEEARAGRPSGIQARMNAITEPGIIQALYRASQAGVKIQLLVRSICRLRPGVPGVSDNIEVRSIVGRFLEHSRVCRFHHGGEELLYCGSADWMERNLRRRVEVVFPIEDPVLRQRVIDEGLEIYFKDSTQSWVLQSDGRYLRRDPPEGEGAFTAQEALMALLAV
jgi:polyphosphate kinase